MDRTRSYNRLSSARRPTVSPYIDTIDWLKSFRVTIQDPGISVLNTLICINNGMEDIFKLIGDVGLPIAGAVTMGFFIFIIIKQIFEGIVENIATLTMFAESLENRARTMSNEMIKIDLLVSSALGLTPDIGRVARAENFVEDGKIDVRRD